jgi:hypothetical protein
MRLLSPLEDLLDLQDGVVARRQALDLPGESDATIRRRLRRREWVTLHPGVYLNHTGVPSWRQRAWAAVLYAAPAVLAGESAPRAADGPGRRSHDDSASIQVAIAHDRDVRGQPGIRIERREAFADMAQMNTSPPRLRIEHAAIDAAANAPNELAAIGVLSDVVRSRRTTAARLLEAALARKRLRYRHLILAVLTDAADGASSVLEVEYVRRVERPHGLPKASRQVRELTGGTVRPGSAYIVYRDGELPGLSRYLELDGRIGHTSTPDRDADFERDLDAALTDRDTLRLGWGQVFVRSCTTAAKLAVLFHRDGWSGPFLRCPRCPEDLKLPAALEPARQDEDFSSPGDEKSSA